MDMELHIDGVDRTASVVAGSVQGSDNLNSQADTLNFAVLRYGALTFRPEIGQEVEYFIDGTKEYGGIIVKVVETSEGNRGALMYSVDCRDYTQDADRELIVETFANETAQDIIEYLVDTYTTGFTYANVSAPVMVQTISFNRIPLSHALDRLASLLNYVWYIDKDRDIHFMPKNVEPAPFNISDGDGQLIDGSLELAQDLSQIRNRVFVRGGDTEGDPVSEFFTGDGTDQSKQFSLVYRYAQMPEVWVDGVQKTVLPDYLYDLTDADFLWSQDQQYIRSNTAWTSDPAGIEVVGIPYIPIVVEVANTGSMTEYGVYEFAMRDERIRSRDEALQYAQAQLAAYANGIVEGSFRTYTRGLRSGQTITITSDARGIVGEAYIIQRVGYRWLAGDVHEWTVEVASAKTIGIIDILQRLIRDEVSDAAAGETLLTLVTSDDTGSGSDEYDLTITEGPYTWSGMIYTEWETLDETPEGPYSDWASFGSETWEDLPYIFGGSNPAEWNRASWG